MLDVEEKYAQQQRLSTYRATLRQWLLNAAQFGGEAFAPPYVAHGIKEARQQIQLIKSILREAEVEVTDHFDDKEPENSQSNVHPSQETEFPERHQKLQQVYRDSRARCISRWQAVGLSLDEAIAFADNPIVFTTDVRTQLTAEHPLRILVGEIGAGKSLVAERFFQQAVEYALGAHDAPAPIYLSAKDATPQLRRAVMRASECLGKPTIDGATIIIDGADEIDSRLARIILDEARELVNAWAHTTILITSRPLPNFEHTTELISLKPFSDQEAHALIQRIAGSTFSQSMTFSWPQQLQEAIRRPLFALLLANNIRAGEMRPDSIGGLLSALIKQALDKINIDQSATKRLLQRLAVFCIDRGGEPLATEIATEQEIPSLLASGLVHREGKHLRFALTIFAEWFAALSLAEELLTAEQLITDPQRLDRWHYPLAMFVGLFHHDQVSRLLCPLAERYPAIAARVIHDGLSQWFRIGGPILPEAQECGRRIRTSMQSWVIGIGPLASLIAPVHPDHTLLTLGVRAQGMDLTTSWYSGSEQLPEGAELPPASILFGELDSGWNTVRSGYVLEKSAWAWHWTLRELESELSPLIQQKTLPIDSGPIANEKLWRIGSVICQYKRKFIEPIPLTLFEDWLSELSPHTVGASVNGYNIDPAWLRIQVTRLRASGNAEIHKPWPSHDRSLGQGGIWSLYSEEQQLARARAVFDAALESYQQVIATWFSPLASAMPIAVALPARLVGLFKPAKAPGYDHHPSLIWWLEPLPLGSKSYIDIQFGERRIDDPRWEEGRTNRRAQLLSMRPSAVSWMGIGLFGYGSDIFHDIAITELVYTWLKYDLRAAFWSS